MAPSIWQILIVILVVAIFFGRGRLSGVMEDLAKGIKSFKKGMQDDDEATPPQQKPDHKKDDKNDVQSDGPKDKI